MSGSTSVEGLGVSGRRISFRSPRRRNLAHRLETQFLTEALQQPEASEKRYKSRHTGELSFISGFLEDGLIEPVNRKSRVSHKARIMETESMQAEREKQEVERKNWTSGFLSTYLHWLKWTDNRAQRHAENVRRNQAIKNSNRRATSMRYHDIFFPAGTSRMSEKEQARAMSETVGEIVLHRIVASTKAHIRRSITRTANQRRVTRQRRSYSQPECQPQKFRHLTTFGDVSELADSKWRIALGNLVDQINTPATRNPEQLTTKTAGVAGKVDRHSGESQGANTDLLAHPLPSCEPCNAFEDVFLKGLAQKTAVQEHLRSVVQDEFSDKLRHALKDFSLSDPPKMSHSASGQPGSLHKYVEKWNQRVRRHLIAPSQSADPYTLSEDDSREAGNFSSKDVTTDFNPAMLFEKSKEKENVYSNMAGKTANIINKKLAFCNWARTFDNDVRLTDMQEWSGELAQESATAGESHRRVQWINGPPYFGNGATQVITDMVENQAVCGMENVQGLANAMAQYVTQENVGKKFVLQDEIDLPKPLFFRSCPP